MTDREMLEQYSRKGSEEAFAELLRRHQNMVYAACLRVLGDAHAAEDAAQATFIILWRKARALSPDIVLSGWLYRTALLAARDYRKVAARSARREQEVSSMAATNVPEPTVSWEELSVHLDAAVAALPTVQRNALVLRYLEGKSEAEAAKEAGCPERTLHNRVMRALQALRQKLERKRLAVSVALLSALLAKNSCQAAPASLITSVQAACLAKAGAPSLAIEVAEEAMKTMFWTKIRFWGAGIAAMLIVCIAGSALLSARASQPAPAAKKEAVAAVDPVIQPQPKINKEVLPSAPIVAEDQKPPAPRDAKKHKTSPIESALGWLAKAQEADGHYDCKRYGGREGQDVATTSLALLSFRGAGHTARVGMYKENVKKGVAWLKEQSPADVTHLALRTLALSENAGMSNSDKDAAQAAADELIARQAPTGEWLAEGASGLYERSISPTTWAVAALKSAKVAGVKVAPEVFERVKGTWEANQLEAQTNKNNHTGAFIAAATATQRDFANKKKCDDAMQRQLLDMLPGQKPACPTDGIGEEAIFWWHGALATFMQGGNDWNDWNAPLKAALENSQVQDGENSGSWAPRQSSEPFIWGRIGATALCTLSLEVYYRYQLLAPGDNVSAPVRKLFVKAHQATPDANNKDAGAPVPQAGDDF